MSVYNEDWTFTLVRSRWFLECYKNLALLRSSLHTVRQFNQQLQLGPEPSQQQQQLACHVAPVDLSRSLDLWSLSRAFVFCKDFDLPCRTLLVPCVKSFRPSASAFKESGSSSRQAPGSLGMVLVFDDNWEQNKNPYNAERYETEGCGMKSEIGRASCRERV